MISWLSPVFVSLVVGFAPTLGHVSSNDELLENAQIFVVEEIDLLNELGAFTSDPIVAEISDIWFVAAETREELIEALITADEANELYFTILQEDGVALSDEVAIALNLLDDGAQDSILRGETGFLDPGPWLFALDDLASRGGEAPAERELDDRRAGLRFLAATPEIGTEITVESAGDTAIVSQEPVSDTPDNSPLDDSPFEENATAITPELEPEAVTPWLAIGVATLLLMLVAGYFGLRQRRTAGSANDLGPFEPGSPAVNVTPPSAAGAQSPTSLNDLLETSRRMTKALDTSEVLRITVAEAMRLTEAEACAFLMTESGNARFVEASPPAHFNDGVIRGGLLMRVLETGQATCAIVEDDPSIARLPVALAATPVVSHGAVAGAIVVLRPASRPFDGSTLQSLNLLSPITGSALTAAETHRAAVNDADVDALTQLHNRRKLDRDLSALRGSESVAFAMVDVDHFKQFNDTNGHQAGDEALRRVASALKNSVRATDLVYRYGGEEFAVIMPGTSTEEAVAVSERARAAIEGAAIPGGESQPLGRVTISAGIVVGTMTDHEAFTLTADEALYAAKRSGRNRVVLAPAAH